MSKKEKRLPAPFVVSALHGEVEVSLDCKPIIEVAQYYYEDGKAGQDYEEIPEFPEVPLYIREVLDSFLFSCWLQGRKEAMQNG